MQEALLQASENENLGENLIQGQAEEASDGSSSIVSSEISDGGEHLFGEQAEPILDEQAADDIVRAIWN